MGCVKFIADIASNHDGSLDRAKTLIMQAAKAGADVVKFQHFLADKIVSRKGFEIVGKMGHQVKWDSPYDVYKRAELPREWTEDLAACCAEWGVDFMSSPYDAEAVDILEPYVSAYKVGSGDINNTQLLEYICKKGKRVLLATGASDSHDVFGGYSVMKRNGVPGVLMQCNTNYTGASGYREHLNLNYIDTLKHYGYEVGLSDHGKGIDSIIGAVAKGAGWIERHFTDDTGRDGPDHHFSMTPLEWRCMVDTIRGFELSLGDGHKRVEKNEEETRIIQRRAWYATRDIPRGSVIASGDVVALRPCAPQMIPVNMDISGQMPRWDIQAGSPVWSFDLWGQDSV